MQEKVRGWLSAPDPWVNQNIARKAHHRDTATWFTQGEIFKDWKSEGSLMWIHGLHSHISFLFLAIADILRYGQLDPEKVSFGMSNQMIFFGALTLSPSSSVIEDITDLCQTGLATLAFFTLISGTSANRMREAYCLLSSPNSVTDPINSLKLSPPSIQPTAMAPDSPARTFF